MSDERGKSLAGDATAAIEPAIAKLIWEAPHRDPDTMAALRTALSRVGTPLAASIARVVGHLADDLLPPAIALPSIAEAGATLVAGLKGTVGDSAVEAAQYQLERLEPAQQKPSIIVPLRRR